MKNVVYFLTLLLLFSCLKEEEPIQPFDRGGVSLLSIHRREIFSPLYIEKERVSLSFLYREERDSPSLYTGESLSLRYREERDSYSIKR